MKAVIMRIRPSLALSVVVALGVAGVLAALYQQHAAHALPLPRAQWAIRRVHAAVFPSFPLGDAGCFTLQPGRSETTVAVLDPSYTDYQTVQCDERVAPVDQAYLVTITQSWDDAHAPTASGLLGWLQRLFYHPASHTWSYRVLPTGRVITLPERGAATPQSYYH